MNARISGIASYVPDGILDNEMLSKMVDTNDEWITTRVGIKKRHILRDPDKGSSYMGIQAVEKLLADTRHTARRSRSPHLCHIEPRPSFSLDRLYDMLRRRA